MLSSYIGSDGLGIRNQICGYVPGISRRMALRQVEQGFFFIFCQIFGIFDDFSKFCIALRCASL